MKPLNRRGQLLIPALLCMATFFLFIALIVEVGRLSRDKIRQQFALDAAASIEMEQYTDLLNKLAYVNGVFPNHVFKEVYGKLWPEKFHGGLFPAAPNGLEEKSNIWPIRYGAHRDYLNVDDPPLEFPVLHMNPFGAEGAVMLDESESQTVSYTMIYQMLGDIAQAQKEVFESLVLDRHILLRKSMWMNLQSEDDRLGSCRGSGEDCGKEAASGFKRIQIRRHALGVSRPAYAHCPVVVRIGPDLYVGPMEGHFKPARDVWQLMTIPKANLESMRKGFLITQHWAPSSNFFGVDFKEHLIENEEPFVQVTAQSSGGHVWPNSTPKYSTRLAP